MNWSVEQVSGLHVDWIKHSSLEELGKMGIQILQVELRKVDAALASAAWWDKEKQLPLIWWHMVLFRAKKGVLFSFSNLGFESPFHLERPRRASLPVFYSLWSMCKQALPAPALCFPSFFRTDEVVKKYLGFLFARRQPVVTDGCLRSQPARFVADLYKFCQRCKLQIVESPLEAIFFLLPGLFVPTSSLCLTGGLWAKHVLFVGKAAWICLQPNESSRCATETNRADWNDALLEETD